MKIEQHYPTRESLNRAEQPYNEALLVLNTLYMAPPAVGAKSLSTKDVIDFYIMSCVHTIVDTLTEFAVSFPSVFNNCRVKTFVKTTSDSMSFENFYVNADYEHTALFGAVYYVLARQQKIDQRYLDFIERSFTNSEHLKPYFMPFKEAAIRKNAEAGQEETDRKDKSKGLTPAQAHLFCEAFLDYLHCTYSNKKETISPLASALFGWALSTMERNTSYDGEDRKYVAKLFEKVAPEFSKHVRDFGNKRTNEAKNGDSKPKGR